MEYLTARSADNVAKLASTSSNPSTGRAVIDGAGRHSFEALSRKLAPVLPMKALWIAAIAKARLRSLKARANHATHPTPRARESIGSVSVVITT